MASDDRSKALSILKELGVSFKKNQDNLIYCPVCKWRKFSNSHRPECPKCGALLRVICEHEVNE